MAMTGQDELVKELAWLLNQMRYTEPVAALDADVLVAVVSEHQFLND